MSGIYKYELTVPRDALDENGHVNNVHYLRWMQDAAVSHSDSRGCTEQTTAVGAAWVVRSHRIEYFRPAFAGDRVAVLTWVANFRKVRSLRKYKIVRLSDNAILAEGATDWVFIDTATSSPRSIPREVSAAFELIAPEDEP